MKCECSLQNLLYTNFTPDSTSIDQIKKINCSDEKKIFADFINEKCLQLDSDQTFMIIISSATLIIIILMLTIILLFYIYKLEIKIFLYSHNFCTCFISMGDLDVDKKYDVFLSYCHKDEDFVLNEIVPKIEQDPRNFKVCIHVRDWKAGEWIQTNIIKSVEESRRTLIVLSKNFIKSKWGMLEFKTAHTQMIKENRTRVIIILYGDIGKINRLDSELRSYLRMNTYIEWGDRYFWKKLFYALSCGNNQLPNKQF